MKQDLEMDLSFETLLTENSDFMETLYEHLLNEDIQLAPEALLKIISIYEQEKFEYFKDFLEQLIGQGNLPIEAEGAPTVIQVVMDGNSKQQDQEKESMHDLDSDLLS